MTTMQRLLQLPANAVNMVKSVQGVSQSQEEAHSPVLTPDSGPQNWYNAVQPEELRHLRSGEMGGGGGSGWGEGSVDRLGLEEGLTSVRPQPLRYANTHDEVRNSCVSDLFQSVI